MNRQLRLVAMLAFVVVTAACSEQPLGRVGDVSRRIVHGDATTTTTSPLAVDQPVAVQPVDAVVWHNDGLDEGIADRDTVVARVWRRGNGVQSFIQASRREVATALPSIRFPGVVPEAVQSITSQLVFEPDTGLLDGETAAAFGMWTTPPYSVGRDAGQLAVLRVGLPHGGDETGDIAAFGVAEGLSLGWRGGSYRYELFCRNGVVEAVCWQMAETMIPLPQP